MWEYVNFQVGYWIKPTCNKKSSQKNWFYEKKMQEEVDLSNEAREKKHLTQEDLAQIIDKKRTYISRVENDGSNITLKTLFDIVEKGLGGKVSIQIDI